MDKLEFVLYGAAAFLAIRSLLSLMAGHRERYAKELAVLLAAELAAKPPESPAPQPATTKSDGGKAKRPVKKAG